MLPMNWQKAVPVPAIDITELITILGALVHAPSHERDLQYWIVPVDNPSGTMITVMLRSQCRRS